MWPQWSLKMCSRVITEQPGNRCFTSTYQSPSMWRCQWQFCKIVSQKKTSIEQFSSLFSWRWSRKSIGIGSTSICSLGETTSKNQWCNCQPIIVDNLKRWSVLQKLSQQETCNCPTRRYSSSGTICPSTLMIAWSMLWVGDVFVTRHLSLLLSTLRTFSTCKWQMALVAKKRKHQMEYRVMGKMRYELRKQYDEKICCVTE